MLILAGNLKRLFNTSGGDFREMDLKNRLKELTETEALELLSRRGNLVKRPFLLTSDGQGALGFKQDEWEKIFPDK